MAENVKITISALDKTKKGFGSATKGLKAVAGAVLNAKTAIVGLVGAAGFGASAGFTTSAGFSRLAQPLRLLVLYGMPLILLAFLRRLWIWLCKGLHAGLLKPPREWVKQKAR